MSRAPRAQYANGCEYDPQLYRLLHRGNAGDLAFYAGVCRKAASVLELGCGYGRLIAALLPRRRHGRYVGLEIHPGLLRLARGERARLPDAQRARVTLVRGDMRAFDLRRRFDRIVIAHSGLFCLTREAEVLACLQQARAHLAPGGELVLDGYAADAFHRDGDAGDAADRRWEWLTRVSQRKHQYDVYERSRWRRERQRLRVHYRYVPCGGGATRLGVIEHRYLLAAQLDALLRRAGLRRISRAGDFRGGAFRSRSELLIVRAGAS